MFGLLALETDFEIKQRHILIMNMNW